MKILIDINHPAHVHFFRNPALLLEREGHEVIFTSRDKDVTLKLLEEFHFENRVLSSHNGKGIFALPLELLYRNLALYKLVKKEKPDIMASIGGTFIAHVGYLTKIQSMVFYDTENATLQNLITYPFASYVVVPNCYQSWTPKKNVRYEGYHELSYLHPSYFSPNIDIAISAGLDKTRKNLLIRLVSWKANHDIGEKGWPTDLLDDIISTYESRFNIIISSERELDSRYTTHFYKGRASEIHHLMAFCDLFVGESATMASESVILGTPAIYAAKSRRGYTDEQESKYKLLMNVPNPEANSVKSAIDAMLNLSKSEIEKRHQQLLSEKIDVAKFVKNFLTTQFLEQQ